MRCEQPVGGDGGNRVVVVRANAEQAQRFFTRDSRRFDTEVKLRPAALGNPAVKESTRGWSRAEMADAEPAR